MTGANLTNSGQEIEIISQKAKKKYEVQFSINPFLKDEVEKIYIFN